MNGGARRNWISALISIGALAIAAVRVLRPATSIDAVTLVLLAAAAVPWLGPVFKSIELTGIGRVEFQELRQKQEENRKQLEQVQGRIASVERMVFPSELSSDDQQRLSAQLETFHRYLTRLRLASEGRELPELILTPAAEGAFYHPDSHQIAVSPELLANPHVLFREYCNYSLSRDDASNAFELAAYDLKSALGFYLPCSFTGDSDGFATFGVDLEDMSPMVKRRGTPSPANQLRAFIWTAILWEARQLLRQSVMDRLVAGAWLATAADQSAWLDQTGRPSYRAADDHFVQHLLDPPSVSLPPPQKVALREILVRRGVLEKPSQTAES